MPVAIGASSSTVVVTAEALEDAAKEVDRQLNADRQYPEIADQLRVTSHSKFLCYTVECLKTGEVYSRRHKMLNVPIVKPVSSYVYIVVRSICRSLVDQCMDCKLGSS